jgi:hypothetical protein
MWGTKGLPTYGLGALPVVESINQSINQYAGLFGCKFVCFTIKNQRILSKDYFCFTQFTQNQRLVVFVTKKLLLGRNWFSKYYLHFNLSVSFHQRWTQPLYYTRLFYAFFFNTRYEYTTHLNVRSVIFRLTSFGWLLSIALTPFFSDWNIIFNLRLFYILTIFQEGK